jgi:hypothetical protein
LLERRVHVVDHGVEITGVVHLKLEIIDNQITGSDSMSRLIYLGKEMKL